MTLGHLPLVAILGTAICVMTFALGFGWVIPVSDAVSALADLIGDWGRVRKSGLGVALGLAARGRAQLRRETEPAAGLGCAV
jgi:hypothetical protein